MNKKTQTVEEFSSEELEQLINDVRSGLKDSVHIHNFVRQELEEVRRETLEEMKQSTIVAPDLHTLKTWIDSEIKALTPKDLTDKK